MWALPPPTKLLPILERLKTGYKLWFEYYQVLPKAHRYTLGSRIDVLLINTIEAISAASFSPRSAKLPHAQLASRKLDTAKVLLLILWETKSLDDKKFIALSAPLEEVGRMLGGWQGQIIKQNSPSTAPGEQ